MASEERVELLLLLVQVQVLVLLLVQGGTGREESRGLGQALCAAVVLGWYIESL